MCQTTLLGYNGIQPHSMIIWKSNGEDKAKTVCYSADEERQALKRFYTVGDLYHSFDSYHLIRETLPVAREVS